MSNADGTVEDDDCSSVDSGILDDEICSFCGLAVNDPTEFAEVIVCDGCSCEFHMACVKIDRNCIPRTSWVCFLCKEERLEYSSLRFHVSNDFKIRRRKRNQKAEILYNPSRPLDLAFEECQKKGLMLVKRLFSFETMKKLTHGVIESKTSSGRVAERWLGATQEIARRISGQVYKNIVFREGRFDITLPRFVVNELDLNRILLPVTERLRSIMGRPSPEIRTHNIIFVPVGSPSQPWHFDDCKRYIKPYRYFTILIHLNTIDEHCGGTEIRRKKKGRGYIHDLVRGRPGDAFVFNGSIDHRGLENEGNMHRFFYYASFSCRTDGNTETGF